uniref:DUF669 domain-containing protein n=1 Tax=viral metagenome TaxID=1070528 RepID=A0A6M3LCV9_9ZZZZ
MPVIDLGVNFEDVKDQDVFEPMPVGTYDFTVASVESKSSATGRPMLKWTLDVSHDGKARKLFNNTVLPWNNPQTGQLDIGGVGMLVAQCKAVGLPWSGGALSTEDYVGRGGQVKVSQKTKQVKSADGTYVDDPNGQIVNDIQGFEY